MRKKRRVEIHIERREISVFASKRFSTEQALPLPQPDGPGLSPSGELVCPTCGAPDLVLLTSAVANDGQDLAVLKQGMQAGSIHFHRSESGQWWLCTRSLRQS